MILTTLSAEKKCKIALERDEATFKLYFLANYKIFEKYAYSFLRDKYMSEDVASEVMWKMWHLGDELVHIINVEQYLFKSVKNKCLNMLRVKQLKFVEQEELMDCIDESLNPEKMLIESQAVAKIEKAIANLPEKTRKAFLLVKDERLTYKQVAENMNISTKTVDRHIQNAVQKLFKFLKS